MLPEELVLIITSYLDSNDFGRFRVTLRDFNYQSKFPFSGKLFAYNFPIFFDKIIKLQIQIPDWTQFYINGLSTIEFPEKTNKFWKQYLTTGVINTKLNMCRRVKSRREPTLDYELFNMNIEYYEVLIRELYPLLNIQLLKCFYKYAEQIYLDLIKLSNYDKCIHHNNYDLYTVLTGKYEYIHDIYLDRPYCIKDPYIYILSLLVNQVDNEVKEGLKCVMNNSSLQRGSMEIKKDIINYLKLHVGRFEPMIKHVLNKIIDKLIL